MILYKKLTREEVLKALAVMAVDTLPLDKDGDIEARYDENDCVEIYFIEKVDDKNMN